MARRIVCQIFTPIGMLGYGFDVEGAHRTLAELGNDASTAIICDSGSTDSGPGKLATGAMTCPRSAYKRDLSELCKCVKKFGVPLLIGSAGGAGLDSQVDELTQILREVGLALNVVQIKSGIDKALVRERFAAGAISPCGAAPMLDDAAIDDSAAIVAQMGVEPYLQAMKYDYDVILGGRAYDPSPYAAFGISSAEKLGISSESLLGAFMHLGKIMECGGLCAVPKSAGAVGIVYDDGSFDIRSTAVGGKCTPLSVAAHSLYEKSRPDMLAGPGGVLDLRYSKYQGNGTVRVTGSAFRRTPYQVKLEAARSRGYRAMYQGFVRDPILIAVLDEQLQKIKAYVASQVKGPWELQWHRYGREEVFLIGEALAPTQEVARAVASMARVATIHGSYPGQKATSGSFGFGIGGVMEFELGECSEFSIYHLMDLKAGEEASLFPCQLVKIEGSCVEHTMMKTRPVAPPIEVLVDLRAVTLGGLASVIRSKNAGPFEITFDVMFEDETLYRLVKESDILSAEIIAETYGIKETDLVWSGFFDQALAYKATIPRRRGGVIVASGGYMEDDVHGSQWYLPLMEITLPQALRRNLAQLADSRLSGAV